MKACACLMLVCIVGFGMVAGAQSDTKAEKWPLAVRIHSYGQYQEAAWTHLPSIGVKYIFLSVPAPADVDATMAKLKKNGLTVVVMRGNAELATDSFLDDMKRDLAICQKMGVRYMFFSAKRKEIPYDSAYARLRIAGETAAQYGVTITVETHPDLGTNGAIQAETMRLINHPNVRINYDPANITYYNKNTSAVKELKKSLPFIGTMEFKDHNGGFETWVFPVIGQGVVGFPEIVALLKSVNYAGPVTLEYEGTKGIKLSEEETKQAIADSVAYARSIADFD